LQSFSCLFHGSGPLASCFLSSWWRTPFLVRPLRILALTTCPFTRLTRLAPVQVTLVTQS
jgi:hypothetical protein